MTHEMADDGNVQVFCRVRPPNEREGGATAFTKTCVTVPASDPMQQTVLLQLKGAHQAAPKVFTFDRVFHEHSSQNEVFEYVGIPITKACLEGYNGTIFAYGQTGSGKTFTMQGPDDVIDADARSLTEHERGLRGLVPRVFDYLFDEIDSDLREPTDGKRVKHTFACSFMEIYNERVYDLLDHGSTRDSAGLKLLENGRKGVSVEGLIESVVKNAKQAAELMSIGARNRRVGQTAMNRESSRSHSVFVLQIQSKETTADGITRTRLSRFNLVDLAGSERQRNTEATGERLKEAGSINKSLSALGNVIMRLVDQSAGKNIHVHYRDSKLTFLLKDSLGGNSKTFMIATVSPAEDSSHETHSTLKFAQRAKLIRNNAIVNEDTSGSVLVLQEEIVRLRRQLQEARSGQNGGSDLIGETRLANFNGASELDGVNSGLRERLEELEASLAFTLEKNEKLMRKNGQLSVQSSRMQELCSELKRNVSNLKLRFRLKSQSTLEEIMEYESSADAIEWRMKYEELEEAYVELQDRARSYVEDDTSNESQELNLMYQTLSKQLAHVIREKHDISRKLDGKPLAQDVEVDKLALLESELARRSIEHESMVNSLLAVNAALEAKAEEASKQLLHSLQKEAAWKIDQQKSEGVIAQLQEHIKQLEVNAKSTQQLVIDERQHRVELEMRMRQEHAIREQDAENRLAEKMTENFELLCTQEELRTRVHEVASERDNLTVQLATREEQLDTANRELASALSSVEVRVQELKTLSADYDRYKSEQETRFQELRQSLSTAQSSITELELKKNNAEHAVANLEEEKTKLEQTVLTLKADIRCKEDENNELLAVQQSSNALINDLTAKCNKLDCDVADHSKLSHERSVKIDELKNEIATSHDRYGQLNAILDQTKEQVSAGQQRVQELELLKSKLHSEISALYTSISSLETTRDDLSSKLVAAQRELAQLEQTRAELSSDLEKSNHSLKMEQDGRHSAEANLAATSESLFKAQSDNRNLMANVDELKLEATKLQAEIETLREELAKTAECLQITEEALRECKEELVERTENYESQVASLKKDCADLESKRVKENTDNEQLVSSLQDRHREEVDELNRLAQKVAGENEIQANRLRADIKDAEVRLATAQQEHKQLSESLERDVSVLKTSLAREKELRATEQQEHDELTRKHNEEVKSLNSTASKQKSEADAMIAELTRSVEAKEQSIVQHDSTVAQLDAKISTLESELSRAESVISELRSTLQNAEAARDEQKSLSTTLEDKLAAVTDARRAAEEQNRTLAEDVVVHKVMVRQRDETLASRLKCIDGLEEQLEQMTSENVKLRVDLELSRQALNEAVRAHEAGLSSLQDSHSVQVERLTSEAATTIGELETKLTALSMEIEANAKEIDHLQSTVEKHVSTIARMDVERASECQRKIEAQQEAEQVKTELKDREKTVVDKDNEIAHANQHIEAIQEEAKEEKVRLSGRIQLLEADLKDLTRAHEVLTLSHSTLTKLHEATTTAKCEAEEKILEHLRRIDDQTKQLEDLTGRVSTLSASVKQLEGDILTQTKAADGWKQQKEEADRVVADLKRLVEQRDEELDEKDSVISGMEETVENLEADKQRVRDELRQSEESLSSLKKELVSKNQALEKTTAELAGMNTKLLAMENEFQTVVEEHKTTQGRLREQLESVTAELDSAKDVVTSQKDEHWRSNEKIDNLSNEIADLTTKKHELERDVSSLELSLQEEEKSHAESRSTWEQTKTDIQEKLRVTERAKCAAEESLSAKLSELSDYNLALQASEAEVHNLLEKVTYFKATIEQHQRLVDELRQSLELQEKKAEDDMTALRQERDHSVEKLSRQRKRNDTLMEANTQLSRDLHEKLAEFDKMNEELLSLRERQSKTEDELQQTKLELASSKAEFEKLNATYTELSTEFDSAKDDLKKKQAHWAAKDQELQGRSSVVGEMEAQIAEDSKKLAEEKVSVAQKRKEAEKIMSEFEKLKVRVEQLETLKIQLSKEREKYRREVNLLTQKLDQISKENDKLVGHDNKRQKIQHHIKVKEENNRLQSEVRLLTEEKMKLEVRIERLELSLKEKENVVNDVHVDLSRSPSSVKPSRSSTAGPSTVKSVGSASIESSARKRLRSLVE